MLFPCFQLWVVDADILKALGVRHPEGLNSGEFFDEEFLEMERDRMQRGKAYW